MVQRRQRRRDATVSAIRAAAIELVAERGLDAVTVEMITERADVGYRTFFNHFGCKEAAIVDTDDDRAERLFAAVEARPAAESPLEAVRVAITTEFADFTDFTDRRREFCLRMSIIEGNPALLPRYYAQFARIEQRLTDAIARRAGLDPDRDLYPRLLASVAASSLRTASALWRSSGSSGTPVQLIEAAFDILARGLTPPVASRP